ncbi:MAG: hypothetical protein ACI9D0_000617 [Bacteroidia bacterium]|jgi:uncharacterized protein
MDRHGLVDVLRGFALLGILAVNIEYVAQHVELGYVDYNSTADLWTRGLVATLGQMKFFLLFSLLFGYGLALQVESAEASGRPLGKRYGRRLLGLILLGVAHGMLFFPGDILVLYGVVGCLAYPLRNKSTATLLRGAALVYGLAALIWLAFGLSDGLAGSNEQPGLLEPATLVAAQAESAEVFRAGSFSDVVALNSSYWPWVLLFLLFVQGPPVFALFLVGVALGRSDLLSNSGSHRPLAKRLFFFGGAVGVAGSAVGGYLAVLGGKWETMGFALGFLFGPALTASYIAGIALVLGRSRGLLARLFESAGRMSLSVYLLESVVATTLMYGYGAGHFGQTGPVAGLGITLGIWLGLSFLAMAWMRLARFGPFEWLLRSVTYAKLQPIRKRPRP